MSNIERLIRAIEENTRATKEQSAFLRALLPEPEKLTTSYGRGAHVISAPYRGEYLMNSICGEAGPELAVIDSPHCRDDLESYGDAG